MLKLKKMEALTTNESQSIYQFHNKTGGTKNFAPDLSPLKTSKTSSFIQMDTTYFLTANFPMDG